MIGPGPDPPSPHDHTPSTELPYATPQAMLDAITARIRNAVEAGGPYTASQLRRQLAYDRLLARVFLTDPDRWVLKGAGNLLARLAGARYSLDLDLLFEGRLEAAAQALRAAVRRDLGDHFRFEVGPARERLRGAQGLTLPVTARVGPRLFEQFGVDLVVALTMTAPPEPVGPLHPIALEGLRSVPYRGYPIVDQIADKHCAILEHHGRHGELPSTRYRDLVDLVLLATTQTIDAPRLRTALTSEYEHRGLEPPGQFGVPDEGEWEAGYRRAATDAPGLEITRLDDAVATVPALLDPVLEGPTRGTWDPDARTWTTGHGTRMS